MNFIKQIERMQYLDDLITKRKTGPPDELAKKLHISRSQLYNIISNLNDLGMQINFSRKINSFYYSSKEAEIEINFSIKIITDRDIHTIYGRGTFHSNYKHSISSLNQC